MVEEKFIFTASAKRKTFILSGVGLVLLILGLICVSLFSHPSGENAASHIHNAGAIWYTRLLTNIWLNNMLFTGIAVIALFFIAFNYLSWAGWVVTFKRVPEAIGSFLPIIGVITLVVFFIFHKVIFHWSADVVSDEIAEKSGYLNMGFFTFRTIAYYLIWGLFWYFLRKNSLKEDLTGELKWYDQSIVLSGGFIFIFGITSSTAAWDWVMSIDAYHFSTMFGWYVFASWFILGLAVISLFVVYLKENGYLKEVNANHIHDLGKYMFAFSIFWTYIWFAQFLLTYYSNLPEEAVYYVARLKSDIYRPFFYFNICVNFLIPFLGLMTRDAKRQHLFIKIVCFCIIIGHWCDFYLMMAPPLLGTNGGMDLWFFLVELGTTLLYTGIFLYVVLTSLTKAGLVPKHHPMLEESIHHQA